jgi:hypothetical protein
MIWSWEDKFTDMLGQWDMRNRFGAELSGHGKGVRVKWPNRQCRELWFFVNVFMHELGHHYRNRYPSMTKRAARKHEEIIANLHSQRYFRNVFRKYGVKSDAFLKLPFRTQGEDADAKRAWLLRLLA